MMGDSTQGWAVTLADLVIILFMITAADLANADVAKSEIEGVEATVAMAEPVAIYRPNGASMPLDAWLETLPDDPRQRLTILVRHNGTNMDGALAQGVALSALADKAGMQARMIVEQSEHPDVAAILAYDSGQQAVARNLLVQEQSNSTEDIR